MSVLNECVLIDDLACMQCLEAVRSHTKSTRHRLLLTNSVQSNRLMNQNEVPKTMQGHAL